jgi:hypothetical protein
VRKPCRVAWPVRDQGRTNSDSEAVATERSDGYRVFLRVRARLRLALADAGGLVA